jgi:hypothetical protein
VNIAFSALVLALLLLPGGLFRYGYLRGPVQQRTPGVTLNLTDNLGWVLVGAVGMHALALWVLSGFGVHPGYDLILPAVTGQFGKDGEWLQATIRALPSVQGAYAAYFAGSSFGAYLLGVLLHALVRSSGLDSRLGFLRFADDWFYILDERANRFDAGPRWTLFGRWGIGRATVLPDVYVTVVVDQKDAAYLYRGIVQGYALDDKGNLDRLELRSAKRRKLTDDRKPGEAHNPLGDDRYYQLVGDLLIVRASEFRTLNVEYVYAAPDDEVEVEGLTINEANEAA